MQKHASIAKITRPRLSKIIPRTRLFSLLDHCRKQSSITWISGPAGSGKTTLVASYLDALKLPCIWYQIDEGDNDVASFFYYLGMAGKNAAPRVKRPLPLLTPEYLLAIPTFSKRYFENLCSRLHTPFIFIFDNYQLISADSPFHEIFLTGLSAIPQNCHVLIVSRTEPHPSYTRALANNQMQALGWEEIQLSPEESREIIHLKTGNSLSADAEDFIINKTQGWAAGIVLMSEQVRLGAVSKDNTANFAPERIFHYFANELFERSEPDTRDFLMKTSLLPKISAAAAESLTGTNTATTILDNLSKRYFFTTARPGEITTYEYHPLFREFLDARARQTYSASEYRSLQKRAATLLTEAGQIEDGARLMIKSEAWEELSALVLEQAPLYARQGRSLTMMEWLGSIPPAVQKHNPWLIYWHGISVITIDPLNSRTKLEIAFNRFKKQRNSAGIFLAWSGIVDTFVFDWSDLRQLDYWISEMDDILKQYHSFPAPEIEARVTYGMFCAMMYRQPQRPAISKWADQAFAIVLTTNDVQLGALLSSHLVLYYSWWRGDTAKASLLVNNLLEHVTSNDISPLYRIVWYGGVAAQAWMIGRNELCQTMTTKGLELADSSGVHLWDFMLLTFGIFDALCRGDNESADKYLKRLSIITQLGRKGDAIVYHWQMGWKALCEKRFADALSHEQAGMKVAEEAGFQMMKATLLQGAAEALIELGDFESSRKYLDEAASLEVTIASSTLEYMRYWLDALYYLRKGVRDKAITAIRNNLALSKEKGIFNHVQWRSNIMAQLYALALEEEVEIEHVHKLIRLHRLVPPASQMHLDNWPWPIKIYAFGEFEILRDDKPIKYSRKAPKKPLELLRVIVALGGKNLSEERLMDLLWPDAEGDSGRKSLSVTLARLRDLLDVKDALLMNEGMISLNDRVVWIDVRAFERLIGDGTKERKDDNKPSHAAHADTSFQNNLQKALDIYRGNFLSGESAAWTIAPREKLQGLFLKAVELLGRYWEQQNEWRKAIEVYGKGIDADDLLEKFYIRIMACLLQTGSQAEALSVYRKLKTTLNGYGVEVSAEAEELHRKIVRSR